MYHNFTLFRAIPVNEEQVKFLQNLPEVYDAQIWKPSSLILRSVDFTISPEDKSDFLKEANKTQMYLTTISSNVQQLFNQQTVKTYIRRQMSTYDWRNYYRVNDIYNWLKDLSYTYQKIMKLIKIGTTVENRTIFAVRISHDLYDKSFKRSTVIVEGGIHAREWISVAFVTYFLHKVLNAPSDTDEEFQRIAFAYDWVFVPLLYPDGYEYTHTQDRLWRKNCNMDGVDLNRNFDVGFGSVGVSEIKSSEIYCGPRAFSEKESSAMRSLLDKFKGKITHYVAFHAYGQYMIIPYAHIKEHVENYDDIFHLGKQMASRIKRRYGTEYVVGTAYDTVGYMTSGVSGCWAKRHHNIP
ncbi:zinc carboxypeptidase A 1 [Amyelois transitella]|uniref:zinc carboxypeptidase A 1 n=1 Tax=Amyelois transitella TaxID=680683 RepID=UPI00298FA9F8|nr:zinc carboxypeptidase A 1 [Amyelois transitella]